MTAWNPLQRLVDWPVSSQQAARRNALLATTDLTRRRVEREEIEVFLRAAAARHQVRAGRAARLA